MNIKCYSKAVWLLLAKFFFLISKWVQPNGPKNQTFLNVSARPTTSSASEMIASQRCSLAGLHFLCGSLRSSHSGHTMAAANHKPFLIKFLMNSFCLFVPKLGIYTLRSQEVLLCTSSDTHVRRISDLTAERL